MSAKVCPISVGWLPGKREKGAWKEGEGEGGLRIESLSLSQSSKSVLGGNIWKLELRIARPICSLNSLQIVPPLRHLHFVLSFLSLQNEKYAVSVCVCECVCVSYCRGLDPLPWAQQELSMNDYDSLQGSSQWLFLNGVQ